MKNFIFLLIAAGISGACQQQTIANNFNSDANQLAVQSAAMVDEQATDWNGTYEAYFSYGKIAGVEAGWQLTITVAKNAATAKGEGYQLFFRDALKAEPSQRKLVLSHLKNLEGYKQGSKMSPEFTITQDKGKFYIKSDWISSDVKEKPSEFGYLIEKKR